jgi:hypothetical protein
MKRRGRFDKNNIRSNSRPWEDCNNK